MRYAQRKMTVPEMQCQRYIFINDIFWWIKTNKDKMTIAEIVKQMAVTVICLEGRGRGGELFKTNSSSLKFIPDNKYLNSLTHAPSYTKSIPNILYLLFNKNVPKLSKMPLYIWYFNKIDLSVCIYQISIKLHM